jgi:protein arginine N-methyltransferase 1
LLSSSAVCAVRARLASALKGLVTVSTYGLQDYGEMIADHGRMDPYVEALRRTVRPESVVLDLGAGLGAFAIVACRLGARRVFAVEPSAVVDIAKKVASANGCGERIDFFHQTSDTLDLPERPTIIVSDLRGALPLYEHHLPSVIDARDRLLAPGGVLIPQRDVIHALLCEHPGADRRLSDPWESNRYELDLSPARALVRNTWRPDQLDGVRALAAAQPCLTLDYPSVDTPDAYGEIEWPVTEAGTAHGFGLWFETTLVPGVGFTNAPGSPVAAYWPAFFPFEEPVDVSAGDSVSLTLRADLVGRDYIWRWKTRFVGHSHGREVKAEFDQSTLLGLPLSLEQLHRTAPSFVPEIGEDGHIDRILLAALVDGRPLGEAAAHVADVFPHRFATADDALPRAIRLSMAYSNPSSTEASTRPASPDVSRFRGR